jgi:serine/threonine protein phosphatase PrpC
MKSNKGILANVGDSKVVIVEDGEPHTLSEDHKPTNPEELRRIIKAGFKVVYSAGDFRITD